MMHIDDYRKLMKLLKSKNSFSVTCYDIVEDKRVTHEMYFAPPSMPIIYQQYLMALGVQEYTIELIGTNNVNTVKVTFHINYGDLDWFTVYTVNKHEPFKIPEVLWVDDSGNEFGQDDYGTVSYWNTNPMDVASKYYRDKSYYFSTDTDLYAIR